MEDAALMVRSYDGADQDQGAFQNEGAGEKEPDILFTCRILKNRSGFLEGSAVRKMVLIEGKAACAAALFSNKGGLKIGLIKFQLSFAYLQPCFPARPLVEIRMGRTPVPGSNMHWHIK